MGNPFLAVQYLESLPQGLSPAGAVERLRIACEQLPITHVLLGWSLPERIEEAVARETSRRRIQLFRWQPLLVGTAEAELPLEWRAVGLDGNIVAGYASIPEFDFLCPNHPGTAEFVGERVESIAARGLFDGLFLDRIRFPSPAADPSRSLACFCSHCRRLAADAGLDLEPLRRSLRTRLAEDGEAPRLARSLLGQADPAPGSLEAFLTFRQRSVTRLVGAAAGQARAAGMRIGLDCFSPALTRMVGQDLAALNETCDWIKIMTYPRVFGPAGIPFELLGLADWLTARGVDEDETMTCLRDASGLPLPATRAELRTAGLGSEAIASEMQRAIAMGISSPLAGIALVEMEGIHTSTYEQLRNDLHAAAGAAGLVLSWDLWCIPHERLELIQSHWEAK